MYFDSESVEGERYRRHPRRGEEKPDPGVGIAWFPGDTANLMTPIHNMKLFRPLRLHDENEELSLENLRRYVNDFLMDVEEFDFDRPERLFENSKTVEFVLSEPFVVERSPPAHMTLKALSKTTNAPVWIGTYMGWSIVPDHSVLLFITIPGGIIVVSSAYGLSSALAAGLSKSIKKLFKD
jgi:hypothetical protein